MKQSQKYPRSVYNKLNLSILIKKNFSFTGNGLAPTPPKQEPIAPPSFKLNLDAKRDVFNNPSPLPYHQNAAPLAAGIVIPEPEPPKPDYSYQAFLTNPPPEEVNIPPASKPLELQSLSNYNTAPRGWGMAKDYYRPVQLGKKFDNLIYSDF